MRALRIVLRVAGWLALVVALLVAAGTLLPVQPDFMKSQLDAAFGATLHFGFATGQSVGTRLISTFGPLGFVFYPTYFPSTFVALFALRALLAAATCWALAWIGYAAWGSPWGAAIAVLACGPFLAVPDVWFLTVPLLAALLELAPRPAPLALRVTLGAAIGLVSLIKFTILITAVAMLAPLTVVALLRRRVPALTIAALTAAVAAWIATAHGLADWLAYLVWSVNEISAGYASAMQLPANYRLTVHTVGVSAAVLVAGVLLAWWRRGWDGCGVAAALAAALYLLFKQGFVRADVHIFITCYGLLVIAVLLGVLWGARPWWRVLIAALLVALLPGWLWLEAQAIVGPPTLYFGPTMPRVALERLVRAPLVLEPVALARAHAKSIADIRGSVPAPPRGPIDIYSYDQSVLLAYDADFRPRPVFQSYMAYSPRLAQANADVLLGERAPDWILFRLQPIDGGLPALQDALSWPLLFARYRFEKALGPFALLSRRSTPLPWRLEKIGDVTSETETSIPVPSADAGPIWARIDVQESERDTLVRTLFAARLLFLDVIRRDGLPHRYRLVPGLAGAGFLLSPAIDTTAEFIRLQTAQSRTLAAQDIVGLRLQVDQIFGVPAGKRPVRIEFSRLVVDDQGPADLDAVR
jgi:hypothetical protein